MVKKRVTNIEHDFVGSNIFGFEIMSNALEQWLDIGLKEISWRVINCIYNEPKKCVIKWGNGIHVNIQFRVLFTSCQSHKQTQTRSEEYYNYIHFVCIWEYDHVEKKKEKEKEPRCETAADESRVWMWTEKESHEVTFVAHGWAQRHYWLVIPVEVCATISSSFSSRAHMHWLHAHHASPAS